jgi:RNA polymerase sigma-70 factor (family 1)
MTEDAIQDIFLKLWKNRTALTGIDNFGSYIFRMAQNQCISHFKRAARETLILAELQQQTPAPGAPDPGNALDAREIQQRLRQALAKLPPQQKLVYTLSREEGLRHEEIAERLHISPSTVKNHMIKALSTLRNQLTNPAATSAFNIIPPVVPAIAIASLLLAIIEAFEK